MLHPALAALVDPLLPLLKKNAAFVWQEAHTAAVDAIRAALSHHSLMPLIAPTATPQRWA